MINFKKATPDQADALTKLAICSKKHWGYDEEILDQMKDYLSVPVTRIENEIVYTMYKDDDLIGFFSLTHQDRKECLEDFFLLPNYIGKGYGKKMWRYMLEVAANNFIMNIHFESEPLAEGFYEKMGAVKIGERVSHVSENRKLPIMSYFV